MLEPRPAAQELLGVFVSARSRVVQDGLAGVLLRSGFAFGVGEIEGVELFSNTCGPRRMLNATCKLRLLGLRSHDICAARLSLLDAAFPTQHNTTQHPHWPPAQ